MSLKEGYKFLVIGRTGSGKDTISQMLSEGYGLKILKSYTNRPMRVENEDTHTFISTDELNQHERLVEKKISGYWYFSTEDQVRENDIYIIDPIATYELVKKMPDTKFVIIYCHAPREKRFEKAITRVKAEDIGKEVTVLFDREMSEMRMFDDFESWYVVTKKSLSKKYKTDYILINNTYTPDVLDKYLNSIEKYIR